MAKLIKIYIPVDRWSADELEKKLIEEGYKWGNCAWETPGDYFEQFGEPQPYHTRERRVLLVYDDMTMMMDMAVDITKELFLDGGEDFLRYRPSSSIGQTVEVSYYQGSYEGAEFTFEELAKGGFDEDKWLIRKSTKGDFGNLEDIITRGTNFYTSFSRAVLNLATSKFFIKRKEKED